MPKRNRHRERLRMATGGVVPDLRFGLRYQPIAPPAEHHPSELVVADVRAPHFHQDIGKRRPAVYLGTGANDGYHLVAGLTRHSHFEDGVARVPFHDWRRYGLSGPGCFWGGHLLWLPPEGISPWRYRNGEPVQLTGRDWELFCSVHRSELAFIFGPDYAELRRPEPWRTPHPIKGLSQ